MAVDYLLSVFEHVGQFPRFVQFLKINETILYLASHFSQDTVKPFFLSTRTLYFYIILREHWDANLKSSPIISNERIIKQDMANCKNKVSWI